MPTVTNADRWDQAHRNRQEYVQQIVDSTAQKRIVVAGPGTGKTYLFKTILRDHPNSLTLSFVNALVTDLCEELFGLSDVKTLHGFARSVLSKAISRSVDIYPKLPAIVRADSRVLRDVDIDFTPLFECRIDDEENLAFYKSRRQLYGRYGFTDIIYAVVLYFEEDKNRVPDFSQIVVDEFQDFNPLEVSLIDLLADRSPVLLAGDDDQALYETL
ncbi:UvrD-helicase domain-containing protein, partial [bacterium]|nr:UvrD-helicase domain-containing protein [bacterium]